MLESFPHRFTSNDRLPEITADLKDVNDVAIDITGYSIKMRISRPVGSTPQLLEITATITDPVNGLFKFSWATGDLVKGDNQLTEVEITDTGGLPNTSTKFYLDVDGELG